MGMAGRSANSARRRRSRGLRDHAAALLERALLLRDLTPRQPQLFIVGLPRSGTTLIYQYIVHRLQVAYFTNGVGDNPRAPSVVTWYQSRRYGPYRSDFRSQYGKVQGPVAPREAGSFWGRFLGLHDYVRFGDVPPEHMRALRRTIAWVERIFGGAPFVNKNVKHLLRIDALAQIFPDSRFLVVEREARDVALSVLRARRSQPDPDAWWSVRPRNCSELLHLPVHEQVAHQLAALQRQLRADVSALPSSRVLAVRYETFCARPEAFIESVRPLLGGPGDRSDPMPSFPCSTNRPYTGEEEALFGHPLLDDVQEQLLTASMPADPAFVR